MCLIIHKPADVKTISRETIASAVRMNPDGFGVMANGKAERFLNISADECAEVIARYSDANACFHWRYATHGSVRNALVHPMPIGDYWAMHNGVIYGYTQGKGNADESDTRRFLNKWIAPRIRRGGFPIVSSIEKEIGYGNKMVFMDRAGGFTFVNKSAGMMHGGCWYSNAYAWDAPMTTRIRSGANSYAAQFGNYLHASVDDDYGYASRVIDISGNVKHAKRDPIRAYGMRSMCEELVINAMDDYGPDIGDYFAPHKGSSNSDWTAYGEWQTGQITGTAYIRRVSDALLLEMVRSL